MSLWMASLLYVGLPAGVLTLVALRMMAKPPLWLTAALTAAPIAFWTAVATVVGYLLSTDAAEALLWFVAAG